MISRRKVKIVSEQPHRKGSKAHLSGFGTMAVAQLAQCSKRTVERAIEAKKLDMGSMASVMAWIELTRL